MYLLLRTLLVSLLCTSSLRAALTADNLLLVVNKNVPESQQLAEHYAQQRHVPDGRILALDLPNTDEIDADSFDEKIVVPIREFLISNHLNGRVTCIVNFYGVPLRIPNRANSADLREELVSLRKQLREASKQAQALLGSLEKLAGEVDSSFKAPATAPGDAVEMLTRRADRAGGVIFARLQRMPPGAERDHLETRFKALADQFTAPVKVFEAPTQPATAPATTREILTKQQIADRMMELSLHKGDRAARRAMRDFTREYAGILTFIEIVNAQEVYLTPEESEAAVDNELAMLWTGLYARQRWQLNPLNYKAPAGQVKQPMMVMRLDGSSADQVRSIIDTSIKIENEGLKGKIVLDSRGIAARSINGKIDGYGAYDQTIRNLGALLRGKNGIDLLEDDRPGLLPPQSAKDVAVYCGWYSAGKFVPSVSLASGAVAVHIASYEMTSLHLVNTGWCRNLLDGGAVATFGPVAEPYLHAFPAADEFFGLLFTGKLTLAETYWATTPLISWKLTMVGDPLYTPFKVNPALKPEDLPAELRSFLGKSDR